MAGSERRSRELGRDAARAGGRALTSHGGRRGPLLPPARGGRGGRGEPAGPCAGGGGRVRSRGRRRGAGDVRGAASTWRSLERVRKAGNCACAGVGDGKAATRDGRRRQPIGRPGPA